MNILPIMRFVDWINVDQRVRLVGGHLVELTKAVDHDLVAAKYRSIAIQIRG